MISSKEKETLLDAMFSNIYGFKSTSEGIEMIQNLRFKDTFGINNKTLEELE